ncbi:hypothetical protein [Microbacterium testaceum]|uniref:hypothetical protein n=1 Tax=Microbacterium testaceum TaxID=2033 RepID=UPI00380C12F0
MESSLPADEDLAEDEIPQVSIKFPKGRSSRTVYFDEDDASTLLAEGFEQVSFLGQYDAFLDRSSGVIEASLGGPSGARMFGTSLSRLVKLPGVRDLSFRHSDAKEQSPDDGEDRPIRLSGIPEEWVLKIPAPDGENPRIELGSMSRLGSVLLWGHRASIRIIGADISTHDSAVAALERYGNGLTFELDTVFGIVTRLATVRVRARRLKRKIPNRVPSFPRNKYAQQALSLYQYGRSAAGLPLLEYLAYYQSMEYFFPFFAREQTLTSLKSVLMHPGFDPTDEADLARLLDLSGGRVFVSERDQLRATVNACVSEQDLRSFLTADPDFRSYFEEKKQKLEGVYAIRFSGSTEDVRRQTADRIYTIRCRIVHAKQDGGATSSDVLLPASAEADAMTPDIELARWLAQQVLIGRAART